MVRQIARELHGLSGVDYQSHGGGLARAVLIAYRGGEMTESRTTTLELTRRVAMCA